MREAALPLAQQLGRVFLSHSSGDKPFVRLLASDIAASGILIWIDELELELADSLIEKISGAIEESSFVAACLSPRSIASKWVQRELAIGLAFRGGKMTVIPLLLRGLEDESIPAGLADLVYADFRAPEKYDRAFQRLLRILKAAHAPRTPPDILAVLAETPVPVDDRRISRLLRVADQDDMRAWIVEYLRLAATTHADPTDRYWIYTGLGHLGGDEAAAALRGGLNDPAPWARQGATEAAKKLGIL